MLRKIGGATQQGIGQLRVPLSSGITGTFCFILLDVQGFLNALQETIPSKMRKNKALRNFLMLKKNNALKDKF